MIILGLDISTKAIGIAILNDREEIKLSEVFFFEASDSLEKRAGIFHKKLREIKKGFKIDKIVVEAPFISFDGGGQAQTTALLQRFNGMLCYILYSLFRKEPELLNVVSARSKLGIKIPRGKKTKHQKKKPIIDFIYDKYKDSNTPFLYELTYKGNPKKGTDDIADSIVLCLASPFFS